MLQKNMADEHSSCGKVGTRILRQRTKPQPCQQEIVSNVNNQDSNDDSDAMSVDEDKDPISTPAALFTNDDMVGGAVYGFKTPKRKGAMSLAAQGSVHSLKKSRQRIQSARKTPARSEETLKESPSKINKDGRLSRSKSKVQELAALRMVLSGSSSNDDDGDSSDSDSSSTQVQQNDNKKQQYSRRASMGRIKHDTVDQYFAQQSHKSVTSNRTLAQLAVPRMEPQKLQEILKSCEVDHIKEKTILMNNLTKQFPNWLFKLKNGFNLLLHGFGSKKKLLEQFCHRMISNNLHIVINGYFPSFNVKELLLLISECILKSSGTFKSPIEHAEFIKKEIEQGDATQLYLIIHNIDGPMLRTEKVQSVLSSLASCQTIHVIASVDHINAPLIWDQTKSSKFNWLWHDATTYQPYLEETSYENSLMVQQSGTLGLTSLLHVLRSLTVNARGIFQLLAKQQLTSQENGSSYQGLSFSELYTRCREDFLVNSDLTLRAQLTEFKDHKLIKTKKGTDGIEYLSIPMSNSSLQQYLDEADDN